MLTFKEILGQVVQWLQGTSPTLNDAVPLLAVADLTGEGFYVAELHRLRGELLQHAECDMPLADFTPEDCLHQALSVARRQHAKSLELRAAMSLARLWKAQDKHPDAYVLLAPIYGWFTEGFDTADLIDAKAFIDELSENQS